MALRKTRTAILVGGVAAAMVLTACGGSSSGGKGSGGSSGGGSSSGSTHSAAQGQQKGGTLYSISFRNYPHLDPQRTYIGAAILFTSRTMVRTLETFPAQEGTNATKLVPDAATDEGKSTDGAKTWSFTLKSGLKWQDGKPVTCEDYKYGISRTFATDQITGGPNYAIQYLAIPTKSDGTSQYLGPYKKTGQALFDKAVVCSGNTITFHLAHPVADFNYATTLPAFAAVRQDKDTGAKYDFTPFSDGPYELSGTWDVNKGGTLVRNPYWNASTDSVDKAYPDKIVVEEGDSAENIASAMAADSGKYKDAVTWTAVPPSKIATIRTNPQYKSRTELGENGFTDYLSVNVKKLPNVKVRQALAMAINKNTYVTNQGGDTAGVPTNSLIDPLVKGYTKYDAFGTGNAGDPKKAKQLLQSAGVSLPVKITYDYEKSPTQDKVAAGFKQNLEAAGFQVSLNGLGDNYYDVIANPSQTPALCWAGWGADWPAASTVIPPLFYGPSNISKTFLGNDYSQFNDPTFNKQVQNAFNMTDVNAQTAEWSKLDKEIVQKYIAAVPLMADRWYFIHGSDIKGFLMSGAFGGYPDYAVLSVK